MMKLIDFAQTLKTLFCADLYFVGGCVRDQFFGEESKDIDCELFNIEVKDFEEFLKTSNIEYYIEPTAKFPVYRVQFIDCEAEIGFPRRDNKTGSKHSDYEIEVDPFMTIKDAAKRRDFTINAIYQNVITKEYIDPFGGINACIDKRLLAVDDETFKEDALRLLRAFQFVARFNLNTDKFSFDASMLDELKDIAPTSIYQEFQKAINKGKHFSEALQYLADFNILKELFPEIARMIGCQHSLVHHKEGDVWEHTKRVVQAAMNTSDDTYRKIIFYAALLHDIGKPLTSTWSEKKNDYTTYEHDKIGAEIAEPILNALGVPIKMRKPIVSLIKHHMLTMGEIGNKTILKKADQFKTERINWEMLLNLICADELGTLNENFSERMTEHQQLISRITNLGVFHKPLIELVSGQDLIDLGLKEGKMIGVVLKEIRDLQLCQRISTKKEAIEFANRRINNINGEEKC